MIVSRGFSHSGRSIAGRQGYPGLPIVEMDHPLTAPTREHLHPKADAIVEEVIAVLTGDAETLRDTYREKTFRGPDGVCPK
ncbi:MAG: hypothetical protein O7G88_11265 [bacterium]|nr:hypothetical protein [bacterium]